MTTSIRHRCDGCRMVDACFEVQERRTKPGADKETQGINAPWATRFLCEPCCKRATTSEDPPRKITPLSGYKPRQPTTPEPPRNMTLGENWGRR